MAMALLPVLGLRALLDSTWVRALAGRSAHRFVPKPETVAVWALAQAEATELVFLMAGLSAPA